MLFPFGADGAAEGLEGDEAEVGDFRLSF